MQRLHNVSVMFHSAELLIWIKCQCQVWTPGNLIWQIAPSMVPPVCQGLIDRGFQRGGEFPIWTRPSVFIPFNYVLFGTFLIFRDFPIFFGDFPGVGPFPLSRPTNFIESAYEEQSRKGPRHKPDLSRKSEKPPGLENPGLPSPKFKPQTSPIFQELGASSCLVVASCCSVIGCGKVLAWVWNNKEECWGKTSTWCEFVGCCNVFWKERLSAELYRDGDGTGSRGTSSQIIAGM